MSSDKVALRETSAASPNRNPEISFLILSQTMNKAILSRIVFQDILKVSRLLFPMEVEGIIIGTMKEKVFYGKKLVLPPDLVISELASDIKQYRRAKSFDDFVELVTTANKDNPSIQREIELKFCKPIQYSKEAFETFSHDLSEGKKIEAIQRFPSIKYRFRDWVTASGPFVCWHSHPVPSDDLLVRLCRPSETDLIDLLSLIQENSLREKLKAQIIIAISKNMNSLLKAFGTIEYTKIASPLAIHIDQDLSAYVRKSIANLISIPIETLGT